MLNLSKISIRDKIYLLFQKTYATKKDSNHTVYYKLLRWEMIIVGEYISFVCKNHSEVLPKLEDINPFKLCRLNQCKENETCHGQHSQ